MMAEEINFPPKEPPKEQPKSENIDYFKELGKFLEEFMKLLWKYPVPGLIFIFIIWVIGVVSGGSL